MLKKIFLFFLIPSITFANIYEIPFTKENKHSFYLYQTALYPQGVSILKQDDKLTPQNQNYLFLSFDKKPKAIESKNIFLVRDKKRNKKQGIFYNKTSYVQLPNYISFDTGLTISFWLKPFTTDEGQIFSTRYLSNKGINKTFQIFFKKGKIYFSFKNLFMSYKKTYALESAQLKSYSLIPSKKWSYHKLVYNPNNGKLDYYLNNKLDSQTWITESRLENSALSFLSLPKESRFFIGKGYRGLMDDFFLSNNIEDQNDLSSLNDNSGLIYTRVLSLPKAGSIDKLSLKSVIPKNTNYKLEYRLSFIPFQDNTPEEVIPWVEYNKVHPEMNRANKGKYLQARITLFSGPYQQSSPLVKKLTVHYTPLETPIIPLNIKLVSSKGDVNLSFKEPINNNITSYHIYIGTKPNEYFGDREAILKSPIVVPVTDLDQDADTGRYLYKISNLVPYKRYYIRMTSITTDDIESPMSQEVSVFIRQLA